MEIVDMKHVFCIVLAWILIAFSAEFTVADLSTYIVHMDKSAMPSVFATHHDWHSVTIDSLESSDAIQSKPRLLYSYDNAMHGFSVVLSSEHLKRLETTSGFVTAYRDKIIKPHTTHTPEYLSLNTETGLWPASEFGKDVIIGLMDSGVWPESKSYNDDGMTEVPARWKGICQAGYNFNSSMCNRKLIGARYYNEGAKAAKLQDADEEGSPRDTTGHGTHTSTIAAGNYVKDVSYFGYAKGTARGIAPRARVAMYSVSADVGTGSDFIAAMDQAIADGVDVISISLGLRQTPLYENSIAIAGFAAMERGVFVSTSAGNDGPFPMRVENPAPWLLTVGASTIDRQNSATFTLGNGVSTTGWSLFPADALFIDRPLMYNKTLSTCDSSELLSEVSWAIVICVDKHGYLASQIQAVTNSNAGGAIFISKDIRFMENGGIACPGVVIDPDQASPLMRYLKSSSSPTVTMKFQEDVLGVKPAPAVSHYSSRGPSKTYPTILKPDIIAPGTAILAAYSPVVPSAFLGPQLVLASDYSLQSGTSMAAPHAAGVAALLKGAHPEWSPAAIRSAMMTTASQVGNDQSPIRDIGFNLTYATPIAMGAGQIDPNKALDPGLIYDLDTQDYVNHLCYMNFTRKQIIAITRFSKYKCSNTSDLNYPSFMAYFDNNSTTTYEFQRTITNVGSGATTYTTSLEVQHGISISVKPDTLVFTEKNQKVGFSLYVDIKAMERKKGHGYLLWEEVGGNHTVRSPVMVFRQTRKTV